MKVKQDERKPKTLCPTGAFVGRCVQMIDLGTHCREYSGEMKCQRKIRLLFELPGKTHVFDEEKGPQPFVVGREYTLSLYKESHLGKLLNSWRGTPYTDEEKKNIDVIEEWLGKPGIVNVTHESFTGRDGDLVEYATIDGVIPLMDGMDCPEAVNPVKSFDLDHEDKAKQLETFNGLEKFLKEKIEKSQEAAHYFSVQEPEETNPFLDDPNGETRKDKIAMDNNPSTEEDDLPF